MRSVDEEYVLLKEVLRSWKKSTRTRQDWGIVEEMQVESRKYCALAPGREALIESDTNHPREGIYR